MPRKLRKVSMSVIDKHPALKLHVRMCYTDNSGHEYLHAVRSLALLTANPATRLAPEELRKPSLHLSTATAA